MNVLVLYFPICLFFFIAHQRDERHQPCLVTAHADFPAKQRPKGMYPPVDDVQQGLLVRDDGAVRRGAFLFYGQPSLPKAQPYPRALPGFQKKQPLLSAKGFLRACRQGRQIVQEFFKG